MSLYLAVELCVLAIPLALSFDKKVAYYRYWNLILPSIIMTGIIFVTIDVCFTSRGTWGFNPDYHSDIMIAGLPLEELLFFLIIPYSSLFIHFVFISYFPVTIIRSDITKFISFGLVALMIASAIIFHGRIYTFFYSLLTATVILLAMFAGVRILSVYYYSFLIIMVPFIIVNGILTGSFGQGAVFWYNADDISGIRILTIPVEDAMFGFNLVLVNLIGIEIMRKMLKR
ncbi:MAG TPA: lycopene cyclase domain-containing protein [Bacteroidales bacterium]|nr:lycopene cyclase domain-containing protein [Bacteroidales bacterium]